MYKFQTGFRRCLCALLCLMLTGAALAEPLPDGTTTFAEQAGETPTPTPAPTQTPTPAADPTPTPAPTAAPSESPTPTTAPSESPTPTAAPSESPTPTAAPSESPTPTAAPSESPTPTATPSQTPAPSAWDESLCDHTTENCEQAPECTVPGCKHIGVNELGEVVALCDLGQWLFDAADRAAASAMLMRASSARTEVALENGENILYRSGSYTLTGGGENASLYVRQGLAISLWFSDARLLTLNLNSGVEMTLAEVRKAETDGKIAADAEGASADGMVGYWTKIEAYDSELEVEEGDNAYNWNPTSSLTFVPQSIGFYKVVMQVADGNYPVASASQIVNISADADIVPGITQWLSNNWMSVLFLCVGGACLIAIVVILLVKPKSKAPAAAEGEAKESIKDKRKNRK